VQILAGLLAETALALVAAAVVDLAACAAAAVAAQKDLYHHHGHKPAADAVLALADIRAPVGCCYHHHPPSLP
jgi:hypothetical protein